MPDGLCPLGPDNYEDDSEEEDECDPDGTHEPNHPYSEVTEQTDGKFSIVWDDRTVPQLASMAPSTTFGITFPTRTRHDYQENYVDADPVLAEDFWTNDVAIDGTAARICAPSDPECDSGGTKIDGDSPDPRDVQDVSSQGQRAAGIQIDKRVMDAQPAFVDCDSGTYVDAPAKPKYSPGDTVCWQLRIDFPPQLDTGQPTVTDFLPPGVSYVPGSAYATTADTVDATPDFSEAANGVLTWVLDGDVPPNSQVFEWRFRTVGQAVANLPGEIEGNLMKVAYPNTETQSFPMRDAADFERSQPLLELVKGVRDIDDGTVNGPNVDGGTVTAGDAVTFRIDVENSGDLDAQDTMVWDELEDGITCTDVDLGSISNGGTCTGTRIEWAGLTVPQGDTLTLTYDVQVPAWVEPGRTFNDHAGVVSYTSDTNTGGTFEYVPADNIDPSATGVNAPAADDTSHVETPGISFEKTRTTGVTELPGNNHESEATIGERIDYTATIVIPEGTTLYGTPTFTDALGSRQLLVSPPDAAATLNGSPIDPSDFTLDTASNEVSLTFLDTPYVNPAGSDDDEIQITFSARVADDTANHRVDPGHTLTNTAHFAWERQDGTPQNAPPASVTTTIVEPDVAVSRPPTAAARASRPPMTSWSSTTCRPA